MNERMRRRLLHYQYRRLLVCILTGEVEQARKYWETAHRIRTFNT